VVDAVVLEGRSRRDVARCAGISKGWVDKLVERYRAGGYESLQPRSRRRRSCAHAASADVQAAIIQLRHELAGAGHDHGAHTIAHHLRQHRTDVPSDATIWRVLKRHGLITPQPHKRPRSPTPSACADSTCEACSARASFPRGPARAPMRADASAGVGGDAAVLHAECCHWRAAVACIGVCSALSSLQLAAQQGGGHS
jgi:transposase